MWNDLKRFFEDKLSLSESQNDPTAQQHKLQLACAALLFEVMKADFNIDTEEQESLRQLLTGQFSLSNAELDELILLAGQENEQATSLHQFTRLINEQYTLDDKYQLVCAMWQIAYADGRIDKYEEYIIRKIADLMYLPHKAFIQAKLNAEKLA